MAVLLDIEDIKEYRRGPLRSEHDIIVAIEEIADNLNQLVKATNSLKNKQLVWADIADTPNTIEGYGLTGVVAPFEHTHPISQIDGLQEALDNIEAGEGDGVVTWDDVQDKPTEFTPVTHNHDGLYYRDYEVDALLTGKSDVGHEHDDRYYTKGASDALLAGKVNRLGGDFMQGFEMQPDTLTFDLLVPAGFRLNKHGPLDIVAHLEVEGHVEMYA